MQLIDVLEALCRGEFETGQEFVISQSLSFLVLDTAPLRVKVTIGNKIKIYKKAILPQGPSLA